MNKLTIIGNLIRDPELRKTQGGDSVCTFTVAVNRRTKKEQPDADYFRVTAWRALGENCAKWLIKGRKVAVVGAVSISTYTGQDGKFYANLEVTASDVEFLTSTSHVEETTQDPVDQTTQAPVDQQTGFQQVSVDQLPWEV